jgi:hypothetical protein
MPQMRCGCQYITYIRTICTCVYVVYTHRHTCTTYITTLHEPTTTVCYLNNIFLLISVGVQHHESQKHRDTGGVAANHTDNNIECHICTSQGMLFYSCRRPLRLDRVSACTTCSDTRDVRGCMILPASSSVNQLVEWRCNTTHFQTQQGYEDMLTTECQGVLYSLRW